MLKKRDFVKGLTPDVLELFHDAQTNILELNKSRLLALEELALARERIRELEDQLAEAVTGGTYTEQAPASGQHGNWPAASTSPLTLYYSTGWDQAYIHYKKKDSGWTSTPGQRMERGEGDYANHFVVHLDSTDVEFVFNNGRDDWDSPAFGQNYKISGAGTYRIKSGKVSSL